MGRSEFFETYNGSLYCQPRELASSGVACLTCASNGASHLSACLTPAKKLIAKAIASTRNTFGIMPTCILTLLAMASLIGCSEAQPNEATFHNIEKGSVSVKQRGARLLGFGVTEGSVGYEVAFGEAKAAGIQFVELAQQWDEVELSPGSLKSPFLKIANELYPAFDTALVLSINPIDTSSLRVPKHLAGKPFDSAEVIRGFNRFVDFVFAGLPDATIIAVSIGNEVDGWLANDAQKWSEYARFVAAVSKHIKTTQPGIPIGAKTTWPATVVTHRSEIEVINRAADAIMATYYPLNDDFTVRPPTVVKNELSQLVKIAGDKPVFLLETGYPSGSENTSSEPQQAEFIEAVFAAWDQHADSILMVNFVWLYDMSKSDVRSMTKYYAVKTPAFASFLATLGLKTHEGRDKQAFTSLKTCADMRGWK